MRRIRFAALLAVLPAAMVPLACGPPPTSGKPALDPLGAKALQKLADLAPPLAKPQNRDYAQTLPAAALKALKKAGELQKKGKTDEAIKQLKRALESDPNNPQIHRLLGTTYITKRKFTKAAGHLRRAAEYLGDDFSLQVTMGWLAQRKKQPGLAIRKYCLAMLCSNAHPDQPRTARTLLDLGQLFRRQGYWTAALECLDQLETWIQKHGPAYQSDAALRRLVLQPEKLMSMRGGLLCDLRRPKEAVKLLDRAYRRNRSDTATARRLLSTLIQLRRFKDAEKLLLELTSQPAGASAVPKLAEKLCIAADDKNMPPRIWKAYRLRNKVWAPLAISLARSAHLLGADEKAGDILIALLREMPDNGEAVRMLVRFSIKPGKTKTGQDEKSLRLLADLVKNNPRSAEAVRDGVNEVLSTAPSPDDLLKRFSQAALRDTSERKFALHYVAGILAEQSGKQYLAAEHFRRAMEAKEDFLPACDALLSLYLAQRQSEKLDRLLEHIRKQAGEHYFYHYALGRVRLAAGKLDAAVDAFQTAAQQNPTYLPALLKLSDAYLRQASQTPSRGLAESFLKRREKTLKKAMGLAPGEMDVYRRLFSHYVRCKEFDKAGKIAARLVRESPARPDGRIMAAEVYMFTGRHLKAHLLASQLARRFSDSPDVLLLVVRAEISRYPGVLPRAVFDRAVKRIHKLLRSHPDNVRAQRILAQLLARPVPGKYADSAVIWSRLYERNDQDTDVGRAYVAALVRAGQYAFVPELIERLLRVQPADRNLRILLIEAMNRLDKAPAALEKARAWWNEDKNNVENLTLLMKMYRKCRRYKEALKLLEKLSKSDKCDISPTILQHEKMDLLLGAGRLDQASRIALETKNYAWTVRITYELIKAGKFDKAHDLLDRQSGRTKDPGVLELLERLKIMAWVKAGQLDKALEWTDKQLKKSPGDLKSPMALVSVLAEEKKLDTLLREVRRWTADLGRVKPQSDDIRKNILKLRRLEFSLLNEAGLHDKALRGIDALMGELSETKPPPAGMQRTLSELRLVSLAILLSTGRYDQADKRLEKYLADDPNSAELYNFRATVLAELGNGRAALAALSRANALKPDNAPFQNNLAYSLAEQSTNLDKAEKLAKAALRTEGLNRPAMDTLAWVYYKKGQFSRSGQMFLHLLPRQADEKKKTADPPTETHAVMWDHAGDVFYRLGWRKRALRYWKNALLKARLEKVPSREIKLILQLTPDKIQAVEANTPARPAPLGRSSKIKTKTKKINKHDNR